MLRRPALYRTKGSRKARKTFLSDRAASWPARLEFESSPKGLLRLPPLSVTSRHHAKCRMGSRQKRVKLKRPFALSSASWPSLGAAKPGPIYTVFTSSMRRKGPNRFLLVQPHVSVPPAPAGSWISIARGRRYRSYASGLVTPPAASEIQLRLLTVPREKSRPQWPRRPIIPCRNGRTNAESRRGREPVAR